MVCSELGIDVTLVVMKLTCPPSSPTLSLYPLYPLTLQGQNQSGMPGGPPGGGKGQDGDKVKLK